MKYLLVFFFVQAEDGIRDIGVTGVQTCALPISRRLQPARALFRRGELLQDRGDDRSEERRVGKSVDLGGRRIIKKKKKLITHPKIVKTAEFCVPNTKLCEEVKA